MSTFLEEILGLKQRRIEEAKKTSEILNLKPQIRAGREKARPYRLREALQNRNRLNIIAEIKRASPSKGVINDKIDAAEIARNYERGGACAISVLTEEDKFQGSLADLKTARAAVSLPLLRKDFIFDEFQIYEAAEAGADVILLIAAMLDDETLSRLRRLTEDELKMDALVEVHTAAEMERAKKTGASLIGVNNRDLHSFKVSLDVSRELIKQAPAGALMIAESGLRTREDLLELKSLGFHGFLIGETLMKSGNVETELKNLQEQRG
ncbi:MAG TPA: indole-3-glycerol phosphate synthase TrpC [Pyrinomonadaceae bacterium]|nr:indole-3-glycerol phosphate synthase TrpC [Pyrinomonadaceae bacterium]